MEGVVADEEFEVEEILGSQESEDGGIRYLVKWIRYPVAEATFEPW